MTKNKLKEVRTLSVLIVKEVIRRVATTVKEDIIVKVATTTARVIIKADTTDMLAMIIMVQEKVTRIHTAIIKVAMETVRVEAMVSNAATIMETTVRGAMATVKADTITIVRAVMAVKADTTTVKAAMAIVKAERNTIIMEAKEYSRCVLLQDQSVSSMKCQHLIQQKQYA